jgi:hypothetical protein
MSSFSSASVRARVQPRIPRPWGSQIPHRKPRSPGPSGFGTWRYQTSQRRAGRTRDCGLWYRGGSQPHKWRRCGRAIADFDAVAVPNRATGGGPGVRLRTSIPWRYQTAQPAAARTCNCALRYRGGTKPHNRRRHGRATAHFSTVAVPNRTTGGGRVARLRTSVPWRYQTAQPAAARSRDCALRYRGGTKPRNRRRPGRATAHFATVAVANRKAGVGADAQLRTSLPWR